MRKARHLNRQRIEHAKLLNLPELDFLEIQVLVDQQAETEFPGEPGNNHGNASPKMT
ncbi:hypothetical protein [Desulfopila sp. IMCC35008]|uniref:hypothetical protein n=1 Tax=Desulfopila sp. IMCC35008 TaxID=2653858 RepID=UPI0013D20D40|nr:hypothetical protein [Desulfopila sp. IMCC35008]